MTRSTGKQLERRNELVQRTYAQVRDELARRHGIHLSLVRIQQLCKRAEAKIKKQLLATKEKPKDE